MPISDDRLQTTEFLPSSVLCPPTALIRKTSLLRIVPTACGQAADIRRRPRLAPRSMPGDSAPPVTFITIDARSDPTSSRCQISCRSQPRGQRRCEIVFSTDEQENPNWWSQSESNRRPHACKARALPAELWPRNQKTNAHAR